jgi:hypothetical protein
MALPDDWRTTFRGLEVSAEKVGRLLSDAEQTIDDLLDIVDAARRLMESGPFSDPDEPGFCATCQAHLDTRPHDADCAYVALERLLGDSGVGVG